MRRLAEQNHVIWVNWHASRRPSANLGDLRTITGKLWQMHRGPQRIGQRLIVTTPPQIPFPGSQWARKVNARLVRRSIARILSSLPDRPVQLWSFAPDVVDLVGSFNEELVLYYCVDAFGEFPGYDRGLIEQLELALIRKSDVVLTTSQPLYEARRSLHPHVHLVQHGVDHKHLSGAVAEDLTLPEDLRTLPKPVFGFVGVVGEWVDLELVAGLARRRPEASIVIIGPAVTPRAALGDLPNVRWLGGKNHEELPGYLRGFDVGLIPFRKLPLTHHANPIKLYEYLAAGVPVVSTPLPAVRPVAGSVWLADDAETTARCCAEALNHNRPADRACRSQLMANESWTARLEQISDIVQTVIRSRPTPAGSVPRKVAAGQATRARRVLA